MVGEGVGLPYIQLYKPYLVKLSTMGEGVKISKNYQHD